MAKEIVLNTPAARAFAVAIASRSVQVASQAASPGSVAEVTASGGGSSGKHAENSEVLPPALVAVAVSTVPGASDPVAALIVKFSPLRLTNERAKTPSRRSPSPCPLGSHAALA